MLNWILHKLVKQITPILGTAVLGSGAIPNHLSSQTECISSEKSDAMLPPSAIVDDAEIAGSTKIYVDAVVVDLLTVTPAQMEKIKETIRIHDSNYNASKNDDSLNNRELYGTIRAKCIAELELVLTRDQRLLFQYIKPAWNLTPNTLRIIRDPVYEDEFELSDTQVHQLNATAKQWIQSALDECVGREMYGRFSDSDELALVFRNIQKLALRSENSTRTLVDGILDPHQAKRRDQLELQYLVVSKGVAVFLNANVRSEVGISEVQVRRLEDFESVRKGWAPNAQLIREFHEFKTGMSETQLEKWSRSLGSIHSSFISWSRYELLKKDP